MALKKSGGGLPDGFTAVEYIQTSGSQRIDTGVKASSDEYEGLVSKNKSEFGTGVQSWTLSTIDFDVVQLGVARWLGMVSLRLFKHTSIF